MDAAGVPDHAVWNVVDWPWQLDGIRLLPVVRPRLEFARAVRAHLDVFDPQLVVLPLAPALREAWLTAVARLPVLHVIRHSRPDGGIGWLSIEPCDPLVEATRWAQERGREVLLTDPGDVDAARAGRLPDSTVIPVIGYARTVAALIESRFASERALAGAAAHCAQTLRRAQGVADRIVCLVACEALDAIVAALREKTRPPLARTVRVDAAVLPLAGENLVELLGEPPFLQAAWERARGGHSPCLWDPPPEWRRPLAPVVDLRGLACDAQRGDDATREAAIEREDQGRGLDLLARPRLLQRLVEQTIRGNTAVGAGAPSLTERRLVHRFALNQALLDGQLCPDLYQLATAARGCVDDRFARDLLHLAGWWPWQGEPAGAVRLSAADLGYGSRLIALRPRIDRLARPGWRPRRLAPPGAIVTSCSHEPEDLVVEALGRELRDRGRRRAVRAVERSVPFSSSLEDGLDARETVRRRLSDGRTWVKQQVAARGQAGAVVLIFDPDEPAEARFPYLQVWHGENDNESDLAFYSTEPDAAVVVPGIRRAEYGGLLMTWPPGRLGELWDEPIYRKLARNKPELLIVAALDYSQEPLIVIAADRPPGASMHELARRLGRRLVHLPLGTIAPERLRRIRTFHVLESRSLRPLARRLLDPPR